jgi:hypothetical protein
MNGSARAFLVKNLISLDLGQIRFAMAGAQDLVGPA